MLRFELQNGDSLAVVLKAQSNIYIATPTTATDLSTVATSTITSIATSSVLDVTSITIAPTIVFVFSSYS